MGGCTIEVEGVNEPLPETSSLPLKIGSLTQKEAAQPSIFSERSG